MEKWEVENLIDQKIRLEKTRSQYGVSRIPVHSHNGMDSPRIDYVGSLTNRQMFVTSHVFGTAAGTSSNYGHFFTNTFNVGGGGITNIQTNGLQVISISEVHGQAGTDAGDVTVSLKLLDPGDASISGGVTIVTFSLKTTANNLSLATIQLGKTPATIFPGQRLALQTSGTLTAVADVLVTVLLQY